MYVIVYDIPERENTAAAIRPVVIKNQISMF